MDMDGREYRTIGRDFEYLSAWHTHIYSHKDTYSSWHALEWKIPLAFWGFPSGIPPPPPADVLGGRNIFNYVCN